jgi:hypothetical protein
VQLPNADRAVIPVEKLRDYLLNVAHPQNRGKARLFAALGYTPGNWETLASDLRTQHLPNDATESGTSLDGVKYTIIAPLLGPTGSANIKSIWQIDFGSEVPRFISAYGE